MKRIFYIFIALLLFTSCEDYLDVVPDNVATIDYAFRDRVGAEKYLATCYNYLPYFGSAPNDPTIMGGDDIWSHEDANYYHYAMNDSEFYGFHVKDRQNTNSPLMDFWNGLNGGKGLFRAIRDCNVFLENIDKVGPDLSNTDKVRWIAEVKFLKAYYHYYLLRMYGPIPLLRKNLPISTGIDEVQVYRDPFDDCVDYIVQLFNEVIPDLPLTIDNITTEMGRITQPIVLSIKAELLVMAASDLFNGNPDFADLKDNRNVYLFKSEPDPLKWERAAIACKNAIDTCALAGFNRLYEFSDVRYPDLSDATKIIMSCRHVVTDKWNREIIWGDTRNYTDNNTFLSLPYFLDTDTYGYPLLSPTLRMAELFYSDRGVPINEDTRYDYANRYKTIAAPADQKYFVSTGWETAKLHLNREYRFYANLAFDGGVWWGNGNYTTGWVLNMKRGQASGNKIGLRYSITCYYPKKSIHFETVRNSGTSITYGTRSTFPIIRLADLYLLYAEALNESQGPNAEVYKYVDFVRERAGLEGVVKSWSEYTNLGSKPTTKDGMRNIIRQERLIELAFEGKRFWDIRRWKTAADLLNQPIKGWNDLGATTADFYNVLTISEMNFSNKEYLWPIREADLRANGNLIQNPGW